MTLDLGVGITPAEADECIRKRQGFVVDERAGCWLWQRPAVTGFGPFLAFYISRFGEIPDGLEVVHICSGGQRGCVRPTHLDIVPVDASIARVQDPAIAVGERLVFAQRIRDERDARRASRSTFGAELGVSAKTLGDWEEGISVPSPSLHDEIVMKLGWDGLERKYEVLVLVQRIVVDNSAGGAVRQVIDELTAEGAPEKVEVIRANLRT